MWHKMAQTGTMADIQSYVRERVRALLGQTRRTHAELGAAIGLSRAAVSGWLQGRSGIAMDHLPAIASFFELDLERFFAAQEIRLDAYPGDAVALARVTTANNEPEVPYRDRLQHLVAMLDERTARLIWPTVWDALKHAMSFLPEEENNKRSG